MNYVCFGCRFRGGRNYTYSQIVDCPKCGKPMEYVRFAVPANRDDHKLWKLAHDKHFAPRPRRPRRRHLRRAYSPLESWEKELLRAAKKGK